MSKFVQVKTQLLDLAMIKRALDDLQLSYSEETTYRHRWSGSEYAVPLLVRDGSMTFGLRPSESGSYEAVGDDMQMRRIRPAVERISQRYAYRMVLEETAEAGFELVEERVGDDNVIHLTVRRWS